MFLQAKIKSEKDGTPYRVYINDELITERFYTVPHGTLTPTIGVKPVLFEDISNILNLEIQDAKTYDVKIENVPGYPKARVWIEDIRWQETPYEDK